MVIKFKKLIFCSRKIKLFFKLREIMQVLSEQELLTVSGGAAGQSFSSNGFANIVFGRPGQGIAGNPGGVAIQGKPGTIGTISNVTINGTLNGVPVNGVINKNANEPLFD